MVPNLFATMANAPVAFDGFLTLKKALSRGRLTNRQREILSLAVAASAKACFPMRADSSSPGSGDSDPQRSVTVFRLTQKKVISLNPTLKLLKAKRTSALKDTRKMEAQLARLNKKDESAGIAINLRYIVGMFRDYIAILDEAIQSARTPRSRKCVRPG